MRWCEGAVLGLAAGLGCSLTCTVHRTPPYSRVLYLLDTCAHRSVKVFSPGALHLTTHRRLPSNTCVRGKEEVGCVRAC